MVEIEEDLDVEIEVEAGIGSVEDGDCGGRSSGRCHHKSNPRRLHLPKRYAKHNGTSRR